MTSTPGEKVDPAHWVGLLGGFMMFAVVLLVSIGLMFPWWTDFREIPGQKDHTEVSLWILYTRIELAADSSTLNCKVQCDFTKVGSPKIRETRIGWSDVCTEPKAEDVSMCQKIWPVRAGTMLCWFFGLLYAALSTFNFCGAGLPASIRCAPAIKLVLGLCCVVGLVLALSIASAMDVKLEPIPPGTEPVDRAPPKKVELNGPGFLCVVASCVLSVLGSGVAYLAQNVTNHLNYLNDAEQGRPLADVQRDKAPNLDHQVHQSGAHTAAAIKDAPTAVKIGGWTSEGTGSNNNSRPNSKELSRPNSRT